MEKPFAEDAWQSRVVEHHQFVDALALVVRPSGKVLVDVFEVGLAHLRFEILTLSFTQLKRKRARLLFLLLQFFYHYCRLAIKENWNCETV